MILNIILIIIAFSLFIYLLCRLFPNFMASLGAGFGDISEGLGDVFEAVGDFDLGDGGGDFGGWD